MSRRLWIWGGFAVAILAAVALAIYMCVVGLDRAAKTATVVGVFVSLLGLLVAVAGLLMKPGKPDNAGMSGNVGSGVSQSVSGVKVRGRLGQLVRGGRGGVNQSVHKGAAESLDQRVER
ncbi:hypothetical protein [Nocardia bovistercoris]|uniref:Uncharacterized protein n=1 Tax=Nocardia bovistercoris TaxID=2785916 RepID=A0A931IKG9_9NOCA|nr:hypothetical protein [Nocardia bovistercoris]MBH0781682.1 hypothetical protein [Nocardia bovistercoris]